MSSSRFPKPDWANYWRHVTACKLYEAAALSLDIDPDHVRGTIGLTPRPGFRHRYALSKDFDNRLSLAVRETDKTLPVEWRDIQWPSMPGYDDGNSRVDLATFARWAAGRDWSMPRELRELASREGIAAPESDAGEVELAPKGADEGDELGTRERNTLLRLVYVLAKAGGFTVDQPRKAGGQILAKAAELGLELNLTDQTIGRKLKEAEETFRPRR